MTVRMKLILTFLVAVLPLCALSLYQLHTLRASTRQTQAIVDNDFVGAQKVAKVESLLAHVNTNILRMIGLGLPNMISTWIKENEARYTEIEMLIEQLLADSVGARRQKIAELKDQFLTMQAGQRKQVRLIAQGDAKGGTDEDRRLGRENALKTFALLAELTEDFRSSASVGARQNQRRAESAIEFIALALLGSAVLAAVLILKFASHLRNQLGGEPAAARSVVAAVSSGDLTVAVTPSVGGGHSLLGAIGEMQKNLAALVAQIRKAAAAVTHASDSIANENQSLSLRTEQQAASLEETAASLEELSAAVAQNADNAELANANAIAMGHTVSNCEALLRDVATTVAQINLTSKRIEAITGSIDEIASKTNILSLNAAVEAASARDHGRGFSVVATEVRGLAQRSAELAREIRSLAAASSIEVARGESEIARAVSAVSSMGEQAHQVCVRMGEISAATREQSQGVSQISAALNDLERFTQENAGLVEHGRQTTERLDRNSKHMLALVERFHIPNTMPPQAVGESPQQLARRPA